ncbi:MAG: hypothetical protein ACYDHM_15120 [Acidiferrobacterales bacterium]
MGTLTGTNPGMIGLALPGREITDRVRAFRRPWPAAEWRRTRFLIEDPYYKVPVIK